MRDLNLLIPDKADAERDALAEAFERLGGKVHRIARFWERPEFDPTSVRVYGPDSFCLVLQQKMNLTLHSPDDRLLTHVPPEYIRRKLEIGRLGDTATFLYPSFIKPVIPKQFRGAVYSSANALAEECRGLPSITEVFVSEVVTFTAEVRGFMLDGAVLDVSTYEGTADTKEAAEFITKIAQTVALPRSVVVDVGFILDRGWAVIEFNAAWGAGMNGCDPERVLPSVIAASGASKR